MLEGFWIRNYKSLKQVGLGTCFPQFSFVDDWADVFPYELGVATLFVGNSGTGRTSVIDAFSFIADCYYNGVDFACQKRGGYEAVYTHGSSGAMSFGFLFRQEGELDPVTYAVSIAYSSRKIPFIESELLAYRSGDKSIPIFFLQNGIKTIRYLAPDSQIDNKQLTKIEFTDFKHLGLQALESHPRFPVLASLRHFFSEWTLCNFTADPARGLDNSLPRRQETKRGATLHALVKYAVNRYGDAIEPILERIAKFLPKVEKIELDRSDAEKPKLAFKLKYLAQPVPITLLSAATIRLFTYSLLLEEDRPAPLVVIEEPENGLDTLHLTHLLNGFGRVIDFPRNMQLFTTSNRFEIAEALHPVNVWHFDQDDNGHTFVERASDSLRISEHNENEISSQWYRDTFL
jgi:predicted ATPase